MSNKKIDTYEIGLAVVFVVFLCCIGVLFIVF